MFPLGIVDVGFGLRFSRLVSALIYYKHIFVWFGSDEPSSEREVPTTGARGWNDLDDDSDDESVSLA